MTITAIGNRRYRQTSEIRDIREQYSKANYKHELGIAYISQPDVNDRFLEEYLSDMGDNNRKIIAWEHIRAIHPELALSPRKSTDLIRNYPLSRDETGKYMEEYLRRFCLSNSGIEEYSDWYIDVMKAATEASIQVRKGELE